MAIKDRVRKRPPGRPRVVHDPVSMTTRVPADMREALNYAAEDRGMFRQELVRNILHEWLSTTTKEGNTDGQARKEDAQGD